MARERSFKRHNGKEMRLRELTDLIAVRSPNHPPNDSSADPKQRSPELETLAPELPLDEARAFENAGWIFLRSAEATDMTAQASQAKVFVKQSGQLVLGTNRLVVEFPNDTNEAQANTILERYGCRVLENLRFAPELFRIENTDQAQHDSVEVANTLVSSGTCKFAEPELIEVIGER